jgi:hypothetical protein
MTRLVTPSRRLLLAAAFAAVSAPAFASSGKKEEKKEGEGQALDPTYKLGSITIPIIANGRIVNYVFVAMILKLKEGADAAALKDQEPMLRDSIVRAAYKTPFTRADSWKEVDGPRLTSFVLSQCGVLLGKGKVASVEIVKQIPRQQLMPPKSGVKPPSRGVLNP